MEQILSQSSSETISIAYELGKSLPLNTVICFFGDLAAGKTTFIKGLVHGAAGIDPIDVQSPTFTYLHIYQGEKVVYHFDLYRLRDIDEFLSMGFDEYFEAGGICCIEWSERIVSYLPANCMQIHMEHAGEDKRLIKILKK
jgi:tRNA threonylcarbamoyladenosine biosynthesis protein TsaE